MAKHLLEETGYDNLAISQMPDDQHNEESIIVLTEDQVGQKALYENIINKLANLPIKQRVLLEPEQFDQAIELLPYLQHRKEHQNDTSEKREAESVLILLDYINSLHHRVMCKEPIRSRMLSLIQVLQDFDPNAQMEESKQIRIPNAYYESHKKVEKSGEQ